MRNLVVVVGLGLGLSVAACDKKPPPPDDKAVAPKVADTAPAAAPVAPPPPAPDKPAVKTGVLDLEVQEVAGGWKLITPRVTQFFTGKPDVQRQDAASPDGVTVPGAVAQVASGNSFAGLIYIPIPKDLPYDVKKGLKGARDGMMNMFEGHYDARDEKAKLGPFDANHVIADGQREGQKFHVEAWIAYDDTARTVYGLMSVSMGGGDADIAKLPAGFTLRPDANVVDTASSKGLKDLVKKKSK